MSFLNFIRKFFRLFTLRSYSIGVFFFLSYSFLLFCSCSPSVRVNEEKLKEEEEALVEGFDYALSDTAAVNIANEVLKAMGGRKNWNNARYFTWNFLGEQKHYWDKQSGDIRIESLSSNLVILMNVNTKTGRVFVNGREITQADSLGKFLEMGEEMWSNDSYWLFMPFRLVEPGSKLSYLGEDVAQTGKTADVIEVTFINGLFKGKKYHVYVDKNTRFVIQWSYFSRVDNEEPVFVAGWGDYEKYHNLWLASSRGRHEITDIAVVDSLPPHTFIGTQPVGMY